MFEGIGKIGAYAQRKNLELAANYKIKTGKTMTVAMPSSLTRPATSRLTATKPNTKNIELRRSLIKQKLKQGQKLSAEEMRFLKENDSALYKKAKTAQDAREQLERDLKGAKTKAEARQALLRAEMKITAECAEQGGGTLSSDAMGAALSGGAASAGTSATADMAIAGPAAGEASLPGEEADSPQAAAISAAGHTADSGTTAQTISLATTDGNSKDSPAAANAALAEEAVSSEPAAPSAGNPVTAALSGDDDKKQNGDLFDDTLLIVIRALQDAWKEFIHTDEYKDLAEDPTAPATVKGDGKRQKLTDTRLLDLVQAYKTDKFYNPEN